MIVLSHSSIQMYLDCPQKWKLKYVDKLPEKPRHFFSFGKSVHSALEFLYDVESLPAPTLEQVLKFYDENWIPEGYSDSAQEQDYKEQGTQIIRDYYHKHIDGFKIPYFTEYAFQLEVDGVPVRGFVDRVDKVGGDKIAIIDYKTGKSIPMSRVEQDAQLTMYQMACEELLGLKVDSLTFYHLPSQKALTVPPHGQDRVQALRGQIVTVARLIGEEVFDPKPEERKCNWCDFKPHCPVFRHLYATQPTRASHNGFSIPMDSGTAGDAPVARDDFALAELVDRYGRLQQDILEREKEFMELKRLIVAALREKGYVRAFGQAYEAAFRPEERWEFSDKKKVLEAIERAGLWDRIIAPSAPLVQKLMKDPNLPLDLRGRLERLGEKVAHSELDIKRIEEKR